jgi:YHS domain-containing protein
MKKFISILSSLFLFTSLLFAQKSDKAIVFSNKAGAIKGYDPVAYFTQSQPVKGNAKITYAWHGATWHFVNEENKATFTKNPEQYAPQYGGYCAYGVAKGYNVKIEPDAWAIENGKLYLNYDQSVQKDWNKDRKGYIEEANKNWVKKQ